MLYFRKLIISSCDFVSTLYPMSLSHLMNYILHNHVIALWNSMNRHESRESNELWNTQDDSHASASDLHC